MRYATLERDDSVLTFTGFFSLLIHAVMLLFMAFPVDSKTEIKEDIFPTIVTYQNFPQSQQFLTFAADRKIFTRSATGHTSPSSGDIQVPQERFREQTPEKRPTMGPSIDVPTPIEERKIYGQTSTDANQKSEAPSRSQERTPTSSRMRSYEMPTAPDGIVSDYEPVAREAFTPSTSNAQRSSSGTAGAIRSGQSGSGRPSGPQPQTGVEHIPTPTPLTPSARRSGQTQESREFTPPRSSGPTVSDAPSEVAMPTGDPDAPSGAGKLGKRRILYKPLPTYPEWAENQNVQASVIFHVSVGPDGHVKKAYVARSSNYSALDRLAEAAVLRWLWEPRPGAVEAGTATVKFVLKSRAEGL